MTARPQHRVALLDVNVLVALAWPNHAHHHAARKWFTDHRHSGWATTPITEAGFVRVSSNKAAIPTATTPSVAIALLTRLTSGGDHAFWPDDVRGVTGETTDPARLSSYRDVTDAHLVAVASRHGGSLVTFDARIERLVPTTDAPLLQVLSV